MLSSKGENMEYNKEYDKLTLEEIIGSYKKFSDRVVIHNGHVVGFEKEIEVEKC